MENQTQKAVERIHAWFKANGKTLAVAESLTAGNVQAAICALSGASKFFRGGVTAYDIQIKNEILGVDVAHARSVNAVSPQVAQEMALGACKRFDADYGIGTTGYAEPYPAEGVTEPYAFYAIVRSDGKVLAADKVVGVGLPRTEMQAEVTAYALEALDEVVTQGSR